MLIVSRFLVGILGIALFVLSDSAAAAIQVQATRVVYSGQSKGATLSLRNESKLPYMVQSWLDTGDAKSMPKGLPIVVTPPLMRLEPTRESQLRFMYSGQGLPADRESMFWINIQEIPPKPEQENILQIAIRTRIKLFYRPAGLNQMPNEAAQMLQWRIEDGKLLVTNNSKLHVTFSTLTFGADKPINTFDADMVEPGQTKVILSHAPKKSGELHFEIINDYGGYSKFGPVALPANP